MRVRWTTDAADDLERICDYIDLERPDSARRVAESVVQRISALMRFPRKYCESCMVLSGAPDEDEIAEDRRRLNSSVDLDGIRPAPAVMFTALSQSLSACFVSGPLSNAFECSHRLPLSRPVTRLSTLRVSR
jgi:plasmid stabilization system protein ParE